MLRWIEPPDRAEALEDLCGAGRDFEVRRALAPGLLESESPYQLECQGRIVNILIDEFMEDFQLPIQGAWFPEPPWLAAAERQHPVVFDFPRIDVSKMEVAAPPGFVPEKAPQEVKLETPFGHYGLKFALTENGYQVERAFALLRVVVEVEDYAALRDFLSQVRLADLTQLYFVRAGS